VPNDVSHAEVSHADGDAADALAVQSVGGDGAIVPHALGSYRNIDTTMSVVLAEASAVKEAARRDLAVESVEADAISHDLAVFSAEASSFSRPTLDRFGGGSSVINALEVQARPSVGAPSFQFGRGDKVAAAGAAAVAADTVISDLAKRWRHRCRINVTERCPPLGKVPTLDRRCFDAEYCVHAGDGEVCGDFHNVCVCNMRAMKKRHEKDLFKQNFNEDNNLVVKFSWEVPESDTNRSELRATGGVAADGAASPADPFADDGPVLASGVPAAAGDVTPPAGRVESPQGPGPGTPSSFADDEADPKLVLHERWYHMSYLLERTPVEYWYLAMDRDEDGDEPANGILGLVASPGMAYGLHWDVIKDFPLLRAISVQFYELVGRGDVVMARVRPWVQRVRALYDSVEVWLGEGRQNMLKREIERTKQVRAERKERTERERGRCTTEGTTR
jgi:hypothetical protein